MPWLSLNVVMEPTRTTTKGPLSSKSALELGGSSLPVDMEPIHDDGVPMDTDNPLAPSLTTTPGASDLQNTFTHIQTTLTNTHTRLKDTNTRLKDTHTRLKDTHTTLEDTHTTLTNIQTTLANIQTKVEAIHQDILNLLASIRKGRTRRVSTGS